MASKDMAQRRQTRALEAKRDKLMESGKKVKMQLAETRAALKTMRSRRRRSTT